MKRFGRAVTVALALALALAITTAEQQSSLIESSCTTEPDGSTHLLCRYASGHRAQSWSVLGSCFGSCRRIADAEEGCLSDKCCAPSITISDDGGEMTSSGFSTVTVYIKPLCFDCRCVAGQCF